MARIRTIKPEFPQSEKIGKLSREGRLLFVLLFTLVDDAGRARAASRMLASLLYPYDDDAASKMDGWLAELERGEHIRRYEVEGSQYLEVTKWMEHQKIDRPSASRLPAYNGPIAKPRESSRALDADLVSSTLDLVSGTVAPEAPKPKLEKVSRKKPKTQIPEDFKFSERVRSYGKTLGFSDADLNWQQTRFIRHAKENGRLCVEWDSAGENWLDKALEFSGKSPPAAPSEVVDDGYIEVLGEDELTAWDNYARAKGAKSFPRNSRGGWRFPSRWPPGYVPPERDRELPPTAALRPMQ